MNVLVIYEKQFKNNTNYIVMLNLYNAVQSFANMYLLWSIMFKEQEIKQFVCIVECLQIMDVLLSASGIVKSNTIVTAIQTIGKFVVVYFGQYKYIRYLGGVWAFSDAVRYLYHVLPNISFVRTLRYSQYKVLYPIGVGLELATILPVIENVYLKNAVIALYIAIFPQMYNHTSKMETNQYILKLLNANKTSDSNTDNVVIYNKKRYSFSKDKFAYLRNKMSATRYNWKLEEKEKDTFVLKDYGIQISWRLVYLIEYFGAFVAYPLLVQNFTRLDVIMWLFHYGKRIFESAFVHSFSSDTMPLLNVFKNSAYYWGAGLLLGYYAQFVSIENDTHNIAISIIWCLCQAGNGFCHYYLANLRSGNTKEHILPTNALFRIVTCPNYTFEIIGWGLFACLGYDGLTPYFGVKLLFCMIGACQMYLWAQGKKRRYKKLFGDKYKVTGVLLPGI
jgi:very-long-chain enoyl-CoA reductase